MPGSPAPGVPAALLWAEEALRESEARLQEALQSSRSFAFEWNPSTDEVIRSQSCGALLALEGDEALHDTGENFFGRLHPDDRARFVSLVRSLRPGADRYETRYRIRRGDGSVAVLEESGRAAFDASGSLQKLIGITTDVTARERAEEERRKAEERLRVATDAASLGIHDFDVTTGRVQWDARVRELFGVGEDDPITYEVFVEGVHPEDRAGVEAEMARALDPTGEGRYFREYRAISRRDGSERWIAATGRAFFENGRAVRLVGTAQDITERKRTEEALREADRRKNEFIALLSHELRNPLAPIRFAIPIIQAQPLSADAARAVKVIGRQVELLARLVDDLLDVSRITTGRVVLRRQLVPLGPVLSAAVESAAPAITAHRHTLRTTIPDRPIHVNVDPARIAQVVTNLLDNSAKYTPEGGAITLEAGVQNGAAIVRVRDNGIGIPPEALGVIFEMFHRVQRQDTWQAGLGIGLAVARQLVEMHGGTIEARSEGAGCGAEFVLRLPAAPDDRVAANGA